MKIAHWFKQYWILISRILGLLASIIIIVTFTLELFKSGREIPEYTGALDSEFSEFIWANTDNIFKMQLQFNGQQSREIVDWLNEKNAEKIIWFFVEHDGAGTEFGFFRDDPEIHLNTRYVSDIHTSGYFKVHSIQGPYQGWMSVTLKAVGREHIKPLW